MSLLATQLCRHPSLRPVDRDTVWQRHPGVYDSKKGRTVVPAAYDAPPHGPSVFINPVKNAYNDRILPDGKTIEFHPSSSDLVNGRLDRLEGKEATLYAFLGNNMYRTGTVTVHGASRGVYHLRMVSPPLPQAPPPPPPPDDSHAPKRMLWADME